MAFECSLVTVCYPVEDTDPITDLPSYMLYTLAVYSVRYIVSGRGRSPVCVLYTDVIYTVVVDLPRSGVPCEWVPGNCAVIRPRQVLTHIQRRGREARHLVRERHKPERKGLLYR